jgi:E3 ubiquitin-protein ligase HUWE1
VICVVGLLLKAAFHAVMNLWNKKPIKVYGSRISESLLAILSHIIKGESIIKVNNTL